MGNRARISVALCLLVSVVACGPVTLNPTKKEFWLGGTDDKEARERAAAADPALQDSLTLAKGEFMACMAGYGTAHANTRATASEVAEAATAACRGQFSTFSVALRAVFDNIDASFNASAAAMAKIRADSQRVMAQTRDGVAEQGKQATIRGVVEHVRP